MPCCKTKIPRANTVRYDLAMIGVDEGGAAHKGIEMIINLQGWLVVLVFSGPSTHFMSFRARSVNLAMLFLNKPPWQFTSS